MFGTLNSMKLIVKKRLLWLVLILVIFLGGASYWLWQVRLETITKSDHNVSIVDETDSVLFVARRVFYTNIDSARKIAQGTLQQAKPLAIESKMKLLNFVGATYQVQDNYEQALSHYYQALELSTDKPDSNQLAIIYNNLGDVNQRTGNYRVAIGFLIKALDIAKSENLLISVLNNIGTIYLSLEEYNKGEEYLRRACKIALKTNDSLVLPTIFNNLGTVFIARMEIDSAAKYLAQSLVLSHTTENWLAVCLVYNAYGDMYHATGLEEEAMSHYTQALKMAKQINDPYREAYAMMGLAKVFLTKGKAEEALLYAVSAQSVANRLKNEVLGYECNRLFSEIHESKGDYKVSLTYYKEYILLKDQHVNQTSLRQVYNQEIISLNEANKIKQLEIDRKSLIISRKNLLSVSIAIVFVLSLLALFFLFRNYRYRQSEKLHNVVVSLNEKKSRAASEAELLERRRIGRELHDGLGQILSVARLNLSAVSQRADLNKERQTELLEGAIQSIDAAFEELREISHNLTPSVLIAKGLEGAIFDIVNRLNRSNKLQIEFESFGLVDDLDTLIQNTLYRAVQELVNNVIKHAEATSISLQLVQSSDEINLMVEDNGKGFDCAHPGFSESGISNLRSRVEYFHGSVFVDAIRNRGTIVTVTIPLIK